MAILIFKTVSEQRMEILLNEISVLHDDFYIIVPRKELSNYKSQDSKIHYITTNERYMDYHILMKEVKIPDIKFNEIWVLSSSYEYLYTYYDVYAVIAKLRYSKLKYVVINDGKFTMYDLKKETVFSRKYELMVDVIEVCIGLKNMFIKCIFPDMT